METEQKKPTVVPLFFDNYLAVIKNSVGSTMFRNWYCEVDGVRQEVMRDGNFSCALYVTSILKMFGLVAEIQITVHRAIAELERDGWQKIAAPRLGAVIVWDAKPSNKDMEWHSSLAKHIGFCLDETMAVSHLGETQKPTQHSLTYRPILGYYWHHELEKK